MNGMIFQEDFSTFSGEQVNQWLLEFGTMVEQAFAKEDQRRRLLGNLLILEPYVHTLRQGLEQKGETLCPLVQQGLDRLWGYLEHPEITEEFQQFANALFACVLDYNTGEGLTEEQEEFYQEHLGDADRSSHEWAILAWVGTLLVCVVGIQGGQLDFEETEGFDEIGFFDIEELLNSLADACIDLTGIQRVSSRAADLDLALEQVYQTKLYQNLLTLVQEGLRTALTTQLDQAAALREAASHRMILPKQYAADLTED